MDKDSLQSASSYLVAPQDAYRKPRFFKDPIVKSRPVVSSNQPAKGLVAFARGVAVGLPCVFGVNPQPTCPPSWSHSKRHGNRLHPGEGSA
jgi:hypothetical protein